MHRIARPLRRLLPASWRETIARDLEEEAAARHRGAVWLHWQAVRIALPLLTTMGGSVVTGDLRYTVRSLVRARWFSIGAALTFALGIGVNVAVFSSIDRMLLRPLPYGHPAGVVVMSEYSNGQPNGTLAPAVVREARRQVPGIVDLATTSQAASVSTAPEGPRDVSVIQTSWNMLRVLEVAPVVGRDFTEEDARAKSPVAVLKYEAWRARFGGARDVVGKPLWNGTTRVEIVGVLPAGFIEPPTLFDPRADGLILDPEAFCVPTSPNCREAPPTVRLRPGVTSDVVNGQLAALAAGLRQDGALPAASKTEYRVRPMRDAMFGRYADYLWLVAGAASLVLTMCCVNLAGLLLVRGRSREHVVAMQLALGASPTRVAGTALLESLLLSAVGTTIALAVVALTHDALLALLPTVFTRNAAALSDARVLGISIGAATLCSIVAGLLPSLRSTRVDVLPVLQRGAGRRGTARLGGSASLLVVESAIGVLLVSGAAMTGRSLMGLIRTDVGFAPQGLHQVSVDFPSTQGQDPGARLQQYMSALDAIRELPGVRMAAGADVLPTARAAGSSFGAGYERKGQRWQVTDGFFETMGMRVIAGRTIGADDVRARASVAVLSEGGLALVWPGRAAADAIGSVLPFPGEIPRVVVGIVSDVRGAYADTPPPSIYVPITSERFRFLMYVARTAPDGSVPAVPLRERARSLGANPTASATPVATQLSNGVRNDRFRAVLFGTFGLVALLLAAVGLYAMTSFDVSRRTAEVGVRLSLGAMPRDVHRFVIAGALRPVLIGAPIGLALAWWAGRFLQSFLHELDARDPGTLVGVTVLLVLTAVAAAWFPARRASRTDPATVLRAQ